jgi:hypothetical protein
MIHANFELVSRRGGQEKPATKCGALRHNKHITGLASESRMFDEERRISSFERSVGSARFKIYENEDSRSVRRTRPDHKVHTRSQSTRS